MDATVNQPTVYRPALAWFAALGSAWVFVLVMLGAFTTTIGAGMAFADWPLSNGSLNPTGWLSNVAMFAEHSHRLSAATMGIITIILAFWIWKVESRRWLVNLGWTAIGIVLLQGVLGGLRVKLDGWNAVSGAMSVGQLLRIPHGILAQIYAVVLFAIAAALSKPWIQTPPQALLTSRSVGRWGVVCTWLVFGQLVVAATMRHFGAGLAIPTFPLTPEGTLIPAEWTFRIALNFAHRVMALVLTIALLGFASKVWLERSASTLLKNLAALMVTCLVVQVCLGISVIWTGRDPYFTTAHVLVGAFTLTSTFLLTWFAHRNRIEDPAGRMTEGSAPVTFAGTDRARRSAPTL